MRENLLFYSKDDASFYDYCFNLAPFCRVAFIATESYFLQTGKTIIEQLKKRQLKVTSVVFKNKTVLTTESVCGLFNISEDVRVLISFEKDLFPACFYLSSILKIPALVSVKAEDLDFSLQTRYNLRTGKVFDCFEFYDKRQVFLPNDKPNYAELYASITVKRLALIDYKIKCILNKTPYCHGYFSCIKILNGFDFQNPINNRLLETDIRLSIENYDCGGKLFDCGVLFILRNFYLNNSSDCLYFAKTFYKRYFDLLNKNVHYLTDYNLRAETLSKLLNINADDIRRNVKEQLEYISKNRLLFSTAEVLLKGDLSSINKFLDLTVKVYRDLGGKDKSINKDVEIFGLLSCDFSKDFNSATLFREYIA